MYIYNIYIYLNTQIQYNAYHRCKIHNETIKGKLDIIYQRYDALWDYSNMSTRPHTLHGA